MAVITSRRSLQYRVLNDEANRVAHEIVRRLGDREERVALLVGQDVALTTCTLGVLKAGKCCVVLDSSYPWATIGRILQDSGTSLLLTDEESRRQAAEVADDIVEWLNVDSIETDLPRANVTATVSPQALAFILYTSGSTGTPKGVMHSHRTMLHLAMSSTNSQQITRADRIALLCSSGFIGSVRTSLVSLLNGACVLPFDVRAEGLDRLARWLREKEVTVCHFVPTLFRQFVATLTGHERFPKLRLIYLGGEPVYRRDVELFRRYFSRETLLVNGYGTTETGAIARYRIGEDAALAEDSVPVGYAAEDKEVLLLDQSDQEVHDGCGEIAVRSDFLAEGYWRDPEATDRVFSQIAGSPTRRIYRTGDLGRFLEDGSLVHLGRKDRQVKIRGKRLDTRDVEAALLELGWFRAAAVVAETTDSTDARLVAYVVPAGTVDLTSTGIRLSLAEKLPDFMIPSAFLRLERFPETPHGKVDRDALPRAGGVALDHAKSVTTPRNVFEELVATIWATVLGLREVSVDEDFLALGGNSLVASQVVARLSRILGVELAATLPFEAHTVAGMAAAIAECELPRGSGGQFEELLSEVENLTDGAARRLVRELDLADADGP